MKIFKIFKTPKHQQYEYKPRFYDARKEEVETRVRKIQEGKMRGGNVETAKQRITMSFQKKGSNFTATKTYRSKQVFRSNLLLLAIIIALVFVTYLLLNVYLPDFMLIIDQKQG